MKTLVLGGTGLLGQAMTAEAISRRWGVTTTARSCANITFDIRDDAALADCLERVRPELVVNCAGLTDIALCEREPGLAYALNARSLALLASWSSERDVRLIHVSTDHYYTTGAAAAHDEQAPITLVNDYARSKYAGEAFALTADRGLVLRTSIVGIRGWEQPTLAEWAIETVLNDRPAKLFIDAFTSSIDVRAFSRAALDLAAGPAKGLLNLAAREVYSKADFVEEIATQMGKRLTATTEVSVATQQPPRASCLGLDVGRAQAMLGYTLPGLHEVVAAVVADYRLRSSV